MPSRAVRSLVTLVLASLLLAAPAAAAPGGQLTWAVHISIAPTFFDRVEGRATFHNGDPLTAEDVKFSFERYKGGGSAILKARVASVSAPYEDLKLKP